jgi:hypothetical protein
METGYLFKAGAIEHIVSALAWYRENTAAALACAENAQVYARRHFELKNVASEMEDYLQKKWGIAG